MSEKIKTLLIILTPVLAVVAVIFIILQVQKNQISSIMNNFEYMLESFYREGLVKSEIDYDDPVLNQRNVFITTDLDEKQAQTAMKELLYLDTKGPGLAIDLYSSSSCTGSHCNNQCIIVVGCLVLINGQNRVIICISNSHRNR